MKDLLIYVRRRFQFFESGAGEVTSHGCYQHFRIHGHNSMVYWVYASTKLKKSEFQFGGFAHHFLRIGGIPRDFDLYVVDPGNLFYPLLYF